MEEIDRKITEIERSEYTFDDLLNDVVTECRENGMIDNNTRREYSSKLIVIQLLIDLANFYSIEDYGDDEKLKKNIETRVNEDGLMSGYMFYISQNSQFDYSWNYMRTCKRNYKDFLANTVHFLNNVLCDINILVNKLHTKKDMHVVFHDILDVRHISEKPYVKTHMLWENFYRLKTVKGEYDISIKIKDSMLQIGSRKKLSDFEKLIDAALENARNNTSEI